MYEAGKYYLLNVCLARGQDCLGDAVVKVVRVTKYTNTGYTGGRTGVYLEVKTVASNVQIKRFLSKYSEWTEHAFQMCATELTKEQTVLEILRCDEE